MRGREREQGTAGCRAAMAPVFPLWRQEEGGEREDDRWGPLSEI